MNKTMLRSFFLLSVWLSTFSADDSVCQSKKIACITNGVGFLRDGSNMGKRAGQFTRLYRDLIDPKTKKADVNDLFQESFLAGNPNESMITCFSSPLLLQAVLDSTQKNPAFDCSKQLIAWLLLNGANPLIKDSQGLTVEQLVQSFKSGTNDSKFQTYYDEVLSLLGTKQDNSTRESLVNAKRTLWVQALETPKINVRRAANV